MDLKVILHRTTIKSGNKSKVKNQSSKSRQVDVTAKFSTSLNSSINRDEDLENARTRQYTRIQGQHSMKNVENKHQQLREFFQLFLS